MLTRITALSKVIEQQTLRIAQFHWSNMVVLISIPSLYRGATYVLYVHVVIKLLNRVVQNK